MGANFVYVPQTHTPEFRKEFTLQYKKHYPGAKASDAKFALCPDKEDPMGIIEKTIVVKIPAGCAAFW